MIIQLDSTTRIRGTEKCWALERENITKGESRWKGLSYNRTFSEAMLSAYRREIRTHHAEGLEACIAAAEAAVTRYKTILDNFQLEQDDDA